MNRKNKISDDELDSIKEEACRGQEYKQIDSREDINDKFVHG